MFYTAEEELGVTLIRNMGPSGDILRLGRIRSLVKLGCFFLLGCISISLKKTKYSIIHNIPMILLSIRVGGVDLSVASVSISISDILCSIFLCCPNSWCDVANIQTKPTCLSGYCREDSQMNRAIRNYIYLYDIYIYCIYIYCIYIYILYIYILYIYIYCIYFWGGSSPSQIVGKTGKRLSLQPYRNNQPFWVDLETLNLAIFSLFV